MQMRVLKKLALTTVFFGIVCLHTSAQDPNPLVATNATWSYLDDGSDQGAGWRAIGFDDTFWSVGPAQLGYSQGEENDEATEIRFGLNPDNSLNDPDNKHITYYFRHAFSVENAASYSNLLVRLLRDDGAIVYLNDTEVWRVNLDAGEIYSTNFANGTVGDTDESTFFPRAIDPGLLVDGTNVIAVEVHQVSLTSSDVSFALELVGNYTPQPAQVAITSPTNTAVIASALISIIASTSDPDGSVGSVEFYQGAVRLDTITNTPFSFTWSGMATGQYVLRAVATDDTGLRSTSAPVNITIVTPPPTLIARNASWRYLDNGTDQGTAWQGTSFSDAGWASGPAELGYGDGDEATVVGFGPNSASKYVTTYFRHSFFVDNPSLYGSLPYTLTYDDGAAIYVNGTLVQAVNLPTTWNSTSLANGAADYSDFLGNLSSDVLVPGNNVVAIEIHQANADSSDISMAFELLGNLSPSVILAAPSEGQVFNLPANITVTAQALDSDGAVGRVEFFADGNLIGQATTAPYTIVWSDAIAGVHLLTAVAFDNTGGETTSAPVQITVSDSNPPRVVGVSGTTNQLTVEFSKRVTEASATNAANYSINMGVSVLGGRWLPSETTVQLDTAYIAPNVPHIITISGVRDALGQSVASTNITFSVADYAQFDIGFPTPSGSFTYSPGGAITLNASGTNVAGTRDQFIFLALEIQDDFDIQVRVAGLNSPDPWAQAGLMARETTATGSRYAAVFTTPSINGSYFAYRSTLNGNSSQTGSFPVNFPNMWLRLKRVGTVFTGYVSPDDNTWVQLGTVSLSGAVRPMLVGLAGASAVNGQVSAIRFSDSKEVTGGTIGSFTLPNEPPGPSSRNTGITISEIMYHPKSDNQMEFVELFNSNPYYEDISGWRISGSVDYTFPENTTIPGGGFVVIARNPAMLTAAYPNLVAGLAPVFGPWQDLDNPNGSTALPNDEGNVRLRNKMNAVLLDVEYEGIPPWPIAADGAGHSLILARPSYGEADVRAWAASDAIGGNPGTYHGAGFEPLRSVMINEFLAHTDLPQVDFIELYNHSDQPVDISGAYLSDDRDTNKFRIPDNTILPAQGFKAFDELEMGFALSSGGERLYLVNSNQTRVIDALDFSGQANGVSSGRFPDGAPTISELNSVTLGAANSGMLARDIVINEIMYHPISEDDDDEFVELFNQGTAPVDVSYWKLRGGISYTIPTNTIIAPQNFLVIAKNKNQLLSKYGNLNTTNTVGNYGGVLGNGGDNVSLGMLDFVTSTNTNTLVVTTNAIYITVDEVAYMDGGRWGQWSDGGGSSLELMDPRSDNRVAANWADSDESDKAPWGPVEVTAPMDNAYDAGDNTANRIQIMLLGRGECLVDNVEAFESGGANLVPNGDFESGLGAWWLGGNHIRSSLNTSEGFGSANSLYIRASSGGDNGGNRIEENLSGTLPNNAAVTATLRCKARWIAGHPDLLLRVHGGQIEAVGTLQVPSNLGSPGAPNSRAVANSSPAIWDVAHHPILPAAGEAVTVTARIDDPDGVAVAQLRYRIDPATTYTAVTMADNGAGADALANDGVYSATIPGRAANTLVAFYIETTDGQTPSAAGIFPQGAPELECNVRFGDDLIAGNQGIYRLWMKASSISAWQNRERMSNEPLDGTFVCGDFRVIYNAGARFRGSPFIRPGYGNPTAGNTAYVWSLPSDELFIGSDELNLDSLEPTTGTGNQRDATGLREIMAYWIAQQVGYTISYQRQVHLVFNGVSNAERGIPAYADSQQPNGDYMESWYADAPDGEIFKIDDWFEFDTSRTGPGRQGNHNGILAKRTTVIGGQTVHDKGAYRWSWEKKSNGILDDDYTRFYALVDAVNLASTSASYVPAIESVMNAEQWLGVIAFRHVVGDWDGYGYDRGKNQSIYLPPNDKFHMVLWDLDFALGCNGGHGPSQNLFQANDALMTRMYNNLHFRRMYFRALYRLANGPLLEANYRPVLEARYRAIQLNGLNYTSPFVGSGAQGISIPDWINQRRTYILSQISAGAGAGFTVGGPATVTAASDLVTFTGTAPIQVQSIRVNGALYPITWGGTAASPTTWALQVPVAPGTTPLLFQGYDADGQLLYAANKTVTYSGTPPPPEDSLVINEIMFNPLVKDAEYVEIYNTSATASFDLSDWRVNGVDYTFPKGSYISPQEYLVLVKDRLAYINAYGTTPRIFGQFGGNLQFDGETITLERPTLDGANVVYVPVDKVKYESVIPWPVGSNEVVTASSIQVADTSADNSRPLNWNTEYVPAVWSEPVFIPAVTNEGWFYISFTGEPDVIDGTLLFYLDLPGSVYIDDVVLVEGDQAEVGVNLVQNGDFETGALGPWEGYRNASNTMVIAEAAHTGSFGAKFQIDGLGGNRGLFQQSLTGLKVDTLYTFSFWFHTTEEPNVMNYRLSSPFRTGIPGNDPINVQRNIVPANFNPAAEIAPAVVKATPGAANDNTSTLVTVPPLWINEVQANNANGLQDGASETEPWIEIYNAGTNAVSLDGYYLADNYTNLMQWPFPAGASLAAGEFKIVFLDGEDGETSGNEWHASFRLNETAGSIALVRETTQPEVMDYINYSNLRTDESYGAYPDGQPFTKVEFYYATPGGTNDASAPPVTLFINEWMAANSGFILDPADFDADDWFELYNPNASPVDLSGYYLTDDLTQSNKFRIPDGTVIGAFGYMLFWADEETGQNNPDREVHTNFKLGAGGESIGLFSPSLAVIDIISFGPLLANVSEGRIPDGDANIAALDTPTPRGPNVPGDGNTPPTLHLIANQSLVLGQSLALAVTAEDADVPAQNLSFTLTGSVPAGAQIDLNTGLLTWTPGESQAPSVNTFSVQVTDSGVPPMSDSQQITITVDLPPNVSVMLPGDGTVSLAFPSALGRNYQVQYTEDLVNPDWQPIPGYELLAGTGGDLPVTDQLANAMQRFYRIVVLQ